MTSARSSLGDALPLTDLMAALFCPKARSPSSWLLGVGIAPLLGMLEEAAANRDPRSFRLLYAAREPAALAGAERLRELQSRLDLSLRCLVDELARESGYVVGPVCAEHITEMLRDAHPEDVTALVCGPGPMMEVATDALLAAGVPRTQSVTNASTTAPEEDVWTGRAK